MAAAIENEGLMATLNSFKDRDFMVTDVSVSSPTDPNGRERWGPSMAERCRWPGFLQTMECDRVRVDRVYQKINMSAARNLDSAGGRQRRKTRKGTNGHRELIDKIF
jgi:hypothetical protein